MTRHLQAALAAAALLWGGEAAAQARLPTVPSEASASLAGPPAWSEGEPRPFLALQGELGTTEHLRAVAGYGQPWWLWGGLIADGWLNPTQATGTVGARAALLAVNLDVHWRVTRLWKYLPMAPLARHDAVASGEGSTNHAWDFDLWGVIPTPGGYLAWEGLASRLVGAPAGLHRFDEGVHGIVDPPWSGLGSLGWAADLRGGTLQVGGSVDAAWLGRGGGLRWRAGPLASWDLSPRWTLRGQLLFTVAGPDSLPLRPGMGGGVSLGYRWATGADRPPGR